MINLSGCNRCANLDCLSNSSFLFRLSNRNGENLLDSKAVSLAQVSIYSAASRSDSLPLSTYRQDNETWVMASPFRNVSEYVLDVKGVKSYALTFDLESRKTECCGTITTINEAYLRINDLAVMAVARIGYRYQKPEGGFFYKMGFTPLLGALYNADYPERGPLLLAPFAYPLVGLGFGYTLK